jgi:hypothetical protein
VLIYLHLILLLQKFKVVLQVRSVEEDKRKEKERKTKKK